MKKESNKMEYIYPAIFHPNADGSYTITYPDLEGCISEGKSLANAIFMSQSALKQWLKYLNEKELDIPKASSIKDIDVTGEEFVNLICVDINESRAVKRTVSIPKWMDDKAAESGVSLSRILQEALAEKLG